MSITFGKKTLVTQKKIDKGLWSLYMFVLIFAPPIIPYPQLVLMLISVIFVIGRYRNSYRIVAMKSGMNTWIKGMILWVMYVVVISLGESLLVGDIVDLPHYMHIFNRYGMLSIVGMPCCIFVLCELQKHNYDISFFIECIINAGIIEGICSIVAFLSPTIKGVFVSLMEKFTGSTYSVWYTTVRNYGFAGTLVDTFGYGIALIAGICFFYGIIKNQKYILYSLIIAIATLLNSRTGVAIYFISIGISALYVFRKGSLKYLKVIFVAVLVIGLGSFIAFQFLKTNKATLGWVMKAVNSVTNLLGGNGLKNADSADPVKLLFTTQSLELPSLFRMIVGTGHSLYEARGYRHSDIGYINELWLCGIIGCDMLYGLLILLMSKLIRSKNEIARFSGIYMLLAYFVFNVKGIALGYNPGAITMFIVIFIFIYYENTKRRYPYEK